MVGGHAGDEIDVRIEFEPAPRPRRVGRDRDDAAADVFPAKLVVARREQDVFSGSRARNESNSDLCRFPRVGGTTTHWPDHAHAPTESPWSSATAANDAAMAIARSTSACSSSVRSRTSVSTSSRTRGGATRVISLDTSVPERALRRQ
jgi:hypothetical protein